MRRHFYSLLPLWLFLASCGTSPAPASAPLELDAATPPNVLLIVADDLGWADLNCYGNPLVKSPHLDELARSGVQFMQAYAAAPVGTPSRAALQTGIYPARNNNGQLTTEYETLGELARYAGLITAHIGKWPHVRETGHPPPGATTTFSQPLLPTPTTITTLSSSKTRYPTYWPRLKPETT